MHIVNVIADREIKAFTMKGNEQYIVADRSSI